MSLPPKNMFLISQHLSYGGTSGVVVLITNSQLPTTCAVEPRFEMHLDASNVNNVEKLRKW